MNFITALIALILSIICIIKIESLKWHYGLIACLLSLLISVIKLYCLIIRSTKVFAKDQRISRISIDNYIYKI